MPGYAFAPGNCHQALFSVQEKHLRDPVGSSDIEQLAAVALLGEPSFKKARLSSPPQSRRRILLDVMETADVFEVKADMPGVGKQNIKVEIDGQVLTLDVASPEHPHYSKVPHAELRRCDGLYATDASMPVHIAGEAGKDPKHSKAFNGTCSCGEKCSCNPCQCGTAKKFIDGVSIEPCEMKDVEAADLATQQLQSGGTCPCGDKCACNPCKCGSTQKATDRGNAGCCQTVQADSPQVHLPGVAAPQGPSGVERKKQSAAAKWHAAERARRFQNRAIRIPEDADTSSATASYADGVLTVTFRKVTPLSTKKSIRVV